MTQTTDCQNTAKAICGGSLQGDTGDHTQYECTSDLFSSLELPSCENGNPDLTIYWFWYDDVCRDNSTYNKYFARVAPNNISVCRDIPGLSITQDSCEKDYVFTRQSMMIKNITNSTSQKYICFLSNNQAVMNLNSAVIYSINISDPTIVATTVPTTTSFSKTSSTINNSEAPSNSWVLKILLPLIIVVIVVIAAAVIGFVLYKYHHHHQKIKVMQVKALT